MQPVGVPYADTGKVPDEEKGLHASGHITGPDLLELVSTIAPRFVIPVHTENPAFFEKNIEPGQLCLPTKGTPIIL